MIKGIDIINNNIVNIPIDKDIYLAILAEMKRNLIFVDDSLNCIRNKIFTVSTVVSGEQKKMKRFVLRKDLTIEPGEIKWTTKI